MQFKSYIGIIVYENIKSKKGQNFRSNLIVHMKLLRPCLLGMATNKQTAQEKEL